jgi:N-acetylglutamate synthase-like GNAT family acetyltransferase
MTVAAVTAWLTEPSGHDVGTGIDVRAACASDAPAIHGLIVEHLAEGRLLPRDRDEIAMHAHRFVIAMSGGRVVACAELAPLSRHVAEIRSLVVHRDARGLGLSTQLVSELVDLATTGGFERLCAFTHAPSFFVRRDFSIVPHVWLPEKIVTDCHACPHFRHCGQYAVVRELGRARRGHIPQATSRG